MKVIGRYRRSGTQALVAGATAVACLVGAGSAHGATASFTYSPTTPLTAENIRFDGSASVGAVTWSFEADNACNDAAGTIADHAFRIAGTYPVTVCASDADGTANQTRMVTVANRLPTAAFTFFPASPLTDDPVTFTSTSTDPEGPIASQVWDLDGDGQFDDGATPSGARRFPAPGSYSVGLRVVDADGAASSVRQAVAILPRPPALLSPFPVVRLLGTVSESGTRVRLLTVRAPRPSRIEISCRGRGCPRARGKRRRATASVRVRRVGPVRFRRLERRLGVGAVLTVRVTKGARTVGKYTRFRIRRHSPPARKDLCVMPAPRRLIRCA